MMPRPVHRKESPHHRFSITAELTVANSHRKFRAVVAWMDTIEEALQHQAACTKAGTLSTIKDRNTGKEYLPDRRAQALADADRADA